jgi:hypothetical protein
MGLFFAKQYINAFSGIPVTYNNVDHILKDNLELPNMITLKKHNDYIDIHYNLNEKLVMTYSNNTIFIKLYYDTLPCTDTEIARCLWKTTFKGINISRIFDESTGKYFKD